MHKETRDSYDSQGKRRPKPQPFRWALEAIPARHTPPRSRRAVLEVREVVWDTTLLNVLQFRNENVTLGEGRRCTFAVFHDDLPREPFVLARPTPDGGFALTLAPGMRAELVEGDARKVLNDAAPDGCGPSVLLGPQTAATVTLGPLSYHLRLVDPEHYAPPPLIRRVDTPIATLMTLCLLAYVIFTAYMKSLPAPETADIWDSVDERFRRFAVGEFGAPAPSPEPEKAQPIAAAAPKAIGAEGKVGRKDSLIDKTKGSVKSRLENEKAANSSGILGILDAGLKALDPIFGGGGLGAGLDKNLGMLTGIPGLDIRGVGGLGSRGPGRGGGGPALGLDGGLGTKGMGGDPSRRGAIIASAANLKKDHGLVTIETGDASVVGGLDKSVIARIIRKSHSSFRYCYQKELQKNPTLYGKVSIKFMIAPDGAVSSSSIHVSTLRNWAVEECVARTMKRLLFPPVKGGGQVVVTYPFIFSHANGD